MPRNVARGLIFAALSLAAATAFAQTQPSSDDHLKFILQAGGGYSYFAADYGPGHIQGETAWVDYIPPQIPWWLHGLGVEMEARDLSHGRSGPEPPNMREDTGQGGAIYQWRRLRNFHPYAKGLWGFGNVDYMIGDVRFHDTRTLLTAGGGLEYRFHRAVWLRADYEFQRWPDFWKSTKPAGTLTPQGFTFGAVYEITGWRKR